MSNVSRQLGGLIGMESPLSRLASRCKQCLARGGDATDVLWDHSNPQSRWPMVRNRHCSWSGRQCAVRAISTWTLTEVERFRIASGEARVLDGNAIHRIRNPDGMTSIGVHVYGGDLLSTARYMWNPYTQEKSLLVQPQFDNWCDELTAAAALSEQARAGW